MPEDIKRKQLILMNSAQLFAENGVSSTTMRAIGDACGILGGSLYHHFRSKDELVAEILVTALEAAVKRYETATQSETKPIDRLDALIRACLDQCREHPHATRIFRSEQSLIDSGAEYKFVRQLSDSIQRLWAEAIDDAIEAGDIREGFEARPLSLYVRESVWLVCQRWPDRNQAQLDRLADDVVALVLYGCVKSAHTLPTNRP